jgi:DNA modification methylase
LADREISRIQTPYKVSAQSRLAALLGGDLDFHDGDSGYASHNFHSFPAKFPPQLPRKFIENLTEPGDVVLDPMVGSGTTVVEALLAGRKGMGFDIDPLALLLSQVKVSDLEPQQAAREGERVLKGARKAVQEKRSALLDELAGRWDEKTRAFVDYWFAQETQLELLGLIREIEKVSDLVIRQFLEIAFSSIIITKSGGVSLAFDLAHTRPHRAKVVLSQSGQVLVGHELVGSASRRVQLLTKTLRSPLDEFARRLHRNLEGLLKYKPGMFPPDISFGDAQRMPLEDESIDLIVTSPPYIANAIDYIRAHKFSLVWLGYPLDDLSRRRREYIGGESISDVDFEPVPEFTAQVITAVANRDEKKGRVVHRYYSEMTRILREMYRVLKPDSAAVLIVGTSIVKGVDTRIEDCLVDIGQQIGFEVSKIGIRSLDRNRRMLPAGLEIDQGSQIQQRMHEEYVIGFYTPH